MIMKSYNPNILFVLRYSYLFLGLSFLSFDKAEIHLRVNKPHMYPRWNDGKIHLSEPVCYGL